MIEQQQQTLIHQRQLLSKANSKQKFILCNKLLQSYYIFQMKINEQYFKLVYNSMQPKKRKSINFKPDMKYNARQEGRSDYNIKMSHNVVGNSKYLLQPPAGLQKINSKVKSYSPAGRQFTINVLRHKETKVYQRSAQRRYQKNSDDQYVEEDDQQNIQEPSAQLKSYENKFVDTYKSGEGARLKESIFKKPPLNLTTSFIKRPAMLSQQKIELTSKKPLSEVIPLFYDQFDRQKLDRMFKFPASYKQAQIHNIASRFGCSIKKIKAYQNEDQEDKTKLEKASNNNQKFSSHPDSKSIGGFYASNRFQQFQKVPVCPCCENLVANHQVGWCYSTQPDQPKKGDEKFALQTGVALYFAFIKMVILYLVAQFLVFDIFTIISSINGQFCVNLMLFQQKDLCNYTTISGYNLKSASDQKALDIISIISLGMTMFNIVFFICYRRKQHKLITWLDRNNKSQKDFSILIQNIPLFIYQQINKKQVVDFNYQNVLKRVISQKIRLWLRTILQKQDPAQFDQKLEYDFWKYVYMRKVKETKVMADLNCLPEQKRADINNSDFWYKCFMKKAKEEQQTAIKTARQFKLNPQLKKKGNLSRIKQQKQHRKGLIEIKINSKQHIIKRQIIVPSITLCYDLTQIQTIDKTRDILTQLYTKQTGSLDTQQGQIKHNRYVDKIPKNIDRINRQYIQLCRKFALDDTPSFNLSHFTGKAFVSFQYQHYRDYFLRQYEKNKSFFTINGEEITISLTNKPQDVYWFNMKVADSDRKIYSIYSYGILFMLLVLSFAFLFALQMWQNSSLTVQVNENNFIDIIKNHIFSVASAILTNIINYTLSYSIELLSDMEKHKTKSDRLNSLIIKIIITQTSNTAIIYYLLYLIKPSNPLGKQGLAKNILDLVLVSGFISVFLQIFPPRYLLAKLVNKLRFKQGEPINMFQVKLNKTLQEPQFNFAAMYAFYIVFTFVVSFYGFLVPTATPTLIMIFFVQYWVDKYNIFKRYSCPVDFGAVLIKKIFKMFQISMLLFTVGHIYWDLKIHTDLTITSKIVNIVNVFIAFAFVGFQIFASKSIKEKIFWFEKDQFDPNSYTSFLKENAFKKTFYRQNPATSCLKETRLNIKKKQKGYPQLNQYLYQAPDPQFIANDEVTLNKYINLEDSRKQMQKYNKFDVEYYNNYQNDGWDQIEAERQIREQQLVLQTIIDEGVIKVMQFQKSHCAEFKQSASV